MDIQRAFIHFNRTVEGPQEKKFIIDHQTFYEQCLSLLGEWNPFTSWTAMAQDDDWRG